MRHKNDNVLKALAKITDGRIKFGLCVDTVVVYDCNMRYRGNTHANENVITIANWAYIESSITCPVEIKITAANVALIKAGARRWVRLPLKMAHKLIAARGHSFVLGAL